MSEKIIDSSNNIMGILHFVNNEEKNKFVKDIQDIFEKKKIFEKFDMTRPNIFGEGVNIYTKKKDSCWINNMGYKRSEIFNNVKDESKYCIIFEKLDDSNKYYFEKCGGIFIINDNIMSKYTFDSIDRVLWNNFFKKETVEETLSLRVNKYMSNYLSEYVNNIIDEKKMKNLGISDEGIELVKSSQKSTQKSSYNERLESFNKIRCIESSKKLPIYFISECHDTSKNKKNSETVYNRELYNKNKNKYINLDCLTIQGIEVADTYDKVNKYFFHNKKHNADLRTLASQIFNGVLIMCDETQRKNYSVKLEKRFPEMEKLPEEFINGNLKYFVAGIIMDNTKYKNIKSINSESINSDVLFKDCINIKDRLVLGNVYEELKLNGVELFFDFIEYK